VESSSTDLEVAPGKVRIGWIGTGVMGFHMCRHCLDAGYSVIIYNRTRSKCEPLQEIGGIIADSVKEVAENSDIVFSIVGFPADVREVYLNPDGLIQNIRTGGILVDLTTSEPSLAQEIYEAAKARGVFAVDAPVSGGDVGAQNGTLTVMAGGDEEILHALRPVLLTFGKNIRYMGPSGNGQHTKMTNQILIASTMAGVVEGMLYAKKAGLDLAKVIETVGSGAAASWTINNLGPRIVNRNFDPGFFVDHFVKDMGIALKECERMNLELPALVLVFDFYRRLQEKGFGKYGTHALMLVLEEMNDIYIP